MKQKPKSIAFIPKNSNVTRVSNASCKVVSIRESEKIHNQRLTSLILKNSKSF